MNLRVVPIQMPFWIGSTLSRSCWTSKLSPMIAESQSLRSVGHPLGGTKIIDMHFLVCEGVTSNTDDARLAETFAERNCPTKYKYHGVILLPEGLIKSILEVYALLQKVSADNISTQLSPWASALFEFLPLFIRKQNLLYPESDDSTQLSQASPYLVELEINKRTIYKGPTRARSSMLFVISLDIKLGVHCHRNSIVLGHIGYHIIAAGLNGYLATVNNLMNPVNKWRCGAAAPITAMVTVKRYGRGHGDPSLGKPTLHPATVDLKGEVNKWRCGAAAPITAMVTVKRYGRGHGDSSLGKPALHPATVDLKGEVAVWAAAPITAMVTVKRYGRGHGDSSLGKPALHPATVDLKGEGI
ncbi:hypothetical protein OROMI_025499 [Orobanche minor]